MTDNPQKTFDKWSSQFDPFSDEYQDMGADDHFTAGYKAALSDIKNYKSWDLSSLRVRWQPIETHGYPPRDDDPYYGERYSVPVLVGNEHTGGVDIMTYRWDYNMQGWVYATLADGPDPEHYEVQHVTHWALWPKCKLVTLDQEGK